MINLTATGTITYACTLTEKDEAKVREFAKINEISLEDEVKYLNRKGDIGIYKDAEESDYMTDSIEVSEFD